jgi:hypothetical protein
LSTHPSILVLDEVNDCADESGSSGVTNRGFVNYLIAQAVAHDKGLICIIITQNKEATNSFVKLNGDKIRPYPGFYVPKWAPYTNPAMEVIHLVATRIR